MNEDFYYSIKRKILGVETREEAFINSLEPGTEEHQWFEQFSQDFDNPEAAAKVYLEAKDEVSKKTN